MGALRFDTYPDVRPALEDLRVARPSALVVVSNWDASLPEVLDGIGLLRMVDEVVTSASVGVAKPDPPPSSKRRSSARATAPAKCLHVGDSRKHDVDGRQRLRASARSCSDRGGAGGPEHARLAG